MYQCLNENESRISCKNARFTAYKHDYDDICARLNILVH